MEVRIRENEDRSGELTCEFDLSVPEDRAGYRWFQALNEARGSDNGVLLLLLADEGERRVLSALRSILEKAEPPMPEDGTTPPLHQLSPEQKRVRGQLIETIRGVLNIIDLNRQIRRSGASGPLAAAARRGEEHRGLLLERAGQTLCVREAAGLLGTDSAGVEALRATRRLLAIPLGEGGPILPPSSGTGPPCPASTGSSRLTPGRARGRSSTCCSRRTRP